VSSDLSAAADHGQNKRFLDLWVGQAKTITGEPFTDDVVQVAEDKISLPKITYKYPARNAHKIGFEEVSA